MADSVTLWRKLVTVEWEQSASFTREEVLAFEADNPLRKPMLRALARAAGDTNITLDASVTTALYEDLGWKGREVIEDRIERADIEYQR